MSTSRFLLLHTLVPAIAILIACGGDDSAPADGGGDADTSIATDSGAPDSMTPDSGPMDVGPDSAPMDASDASDDAPPDAADVCGDGMTTGSEVCDDANDVDGDGCDSDCTYSCTVDSECDDGLTCNGGETCDATTHTCASDTPLADGAPCDADADPSTRDICLTGTCVASTCGDMFTDVDASEDCDDANTVDGDGCDSDCTFSCAADTDCDDSEPCTGAETCDTTTHTCVDPADLADGTVCDADADPLTRDICLTSVCGASICSDSFVDTGGGELCDDGNTTDGDGCDADCAFTPTAFRITTMALTDPHLYVDTGTCEDQSASLNSLFQSNVDSLDLNIVLVFRPLDEAASTTAVDIVFGECTAGTPPTCQVGTGTSTATTATNAATGTCYSADPTTLNPLYTAPNQADGPCFSTAPGPLTLSLGPISVPAQDVQTAATYSGGPPATSLISGILAGFVTEATAMATELAPGISVYSVLAAGGAAGSSCSTEDDRDTSMGVSGFWMYIDFTATPVDWVDP